MSAKNLFVAMIFGCTITAQASADLLLNGSFEAPSGYAQGAQGVMPPNWQATDSTSPDLYSSDGSFGLSPSAFGNFVGVVAQDGLGWVAGAGASSWGYESFGQLLANPLLPNSQYSLTAYLHQSTRSDLNNPGAYEIMINQANTLVGAVPLVSLDPTTGSGNWEFRTSSFMTPANSISLPWLIFRPYASGPTGTFSYPGLDNVVLTAVPEPSTLLTLVIGLCWASKRRHRN